MKNFITLTILTAALMGCPTITTVDTSAAVDLYEGRLQWRVDTEAQIEAWRAEKATLEAAPQGSTGPNPRIHELAQLIANDLALLDADDTMISKAVRDAATVAFRELLGADVTITLNGPPPAAIPVLELNPAPASTRPGAVTFDGQVVGP